MIVGQALMCLGLLLAESPRMPDVPERRVRDASS